MTKQCKDKKDLEDLFVRYSGVACTSMQDSNTGFNELLRYLPKAKLNNDAPDGYCKLNGNKILIMEHFRFDATKVKKKKGSKIFRELHRVSLSKEQKNKIDCSISINYYWENLKENYIRHCQNFQKYKNNLINKKICNKDTEFELAFFIEDTTPIGAVNECTQKRIYAIFCDKFIDLFENCKNVDYIFNYSEVNKIKEILFVDKNGINNLRENQIFIDKIMLIDWEINSYKI